MRFLFCWLFVSAAVWAHPTERLFLNLDVAGAKRHDSFGQLKSQVLSNPSQAVLDVIRFERPSRMNAIRVFAFIWGEQSAGDAVTFLTECEQLDENDVALALYEIGLVQGRNDLKDAVELADDLSDANRHHMYVGIVKAVADQSFEEAIAFVDKTVGLPDIHGLFASIAESQGEKNWKAASAWVDSLHPWYQKAAKYAAVRGAVATKPEDTCSGLLGTDPRLLDFAVIEWAKSEPSTALNFAIKHLSDSTDLLNFLFRCCVIYRPAKVDAIINRAPKSLRPLFRSTLIVETSRVVDLLKKGAQPVELSPRQTLMLFRRISNEVSLERACHWLSVRELGRDHRATYELAFRNCLSKPSRQSAELVRKAAPHELKPILRQLEWEAEIRNNSLNALELLPEIGSATHRRQLLIESVEQVAVTNERASALMVLQSEETERPALRLAVFRGLARKSPLKAAAKLSELSFAEQIQVLSSVLDHASSVEDLEEMLLLFLNREDLLCRNSAIDIICSFWPKSQIGRLIVVADSLANVPDQERLKSHALSNYPYPKTHEAIKQLVDLETPLFKNRSQTSLMFRVAAADPETASKLFANLPVDVQTYTAPRLLKILALKDIDKAVSQYEKLSKLQKKQGLPALLQVWTASNESEAKLWLSRRPQSERQIGPANNPKGPSAELRSSTSP